MIYGYARVSTTDQSLDSQIDELNRAGVGVLLKDIGSGKAKSNRPNLERLKGLLKEGDTLIIYRLDRLGRSMAELIEWMDFLKEQGIIFKSLTEAINTDTASGKLTFHIFAMLAEYERNLIRERTSIGLAAARARGRNGGRKKKLNQLQADQLKEDHKSGKFTVSELLRKHQLSRASFYEYLKR